MNFNYYLSYFSLLEERIENIAKYIAFEEENLDTYSVELSSIIQDACGLINGICTNLYNENFKAKKWLSMKDYKKLFVGNYNTSFGNGVYIGKFKIFPWQKISTNIDSSLEEIPNPLWWDDYNKIKHNGYGAFKKASLKNAISSVAGVFSLLLMVDFHNMGDTIINWKGSFRECGNYIKNISWEC